VSGCKGGDEGGDKVIEEGEGAEEWKIGG